MRASSDVRRRIGTTVIDFVRRTMSAHPDAVIVDVHEGHVLVTLRQVSCAAEREYARERQARERLERLISRSFDGVKAELETALATILGCRVSQSRLSIDLATGDAVLAFATDGPVGCSPRGSRGIRTAQREE